MFLVLWALAAMVLVTPADGATTQGTRRPTRRRPPGSAQITQSIGATVGDLNGDGLPDMLLNRAFAASRARVPQHRAAGSRRSTPAASSEDDRHGCAMADVNGDGLQDIYCTVGRRTASASSRTSCGSSRPTAASSEPGRRLRGRSTPTAAAGRRVLRRQRRRLARPVRQQLLPAPGRPADAEPALHQPGHGAGLRRRARVRARPAGGRPGAGAGVRRGGRLRRRRIPGSAGLRQAGGIHVYHNERTRSSRT